MQGKGFSVPIMSWPMHTTESSQPTVPAYSYESWDDTTTTNTVAYQSTPDEYVDHSCDGKPQGGLLLFKQELAYRQINRRWTHPMLVCVVPAPHRRLVLAEPLMSSHGTSLATI
jgi:hypothetical protein